MNTQSFKKHQKMLDKKSLYFTVLFRCLAATSGMLRSRMPWSMMSQGGYEVELSVAELFFLGQLLVFIMFGPIFFLIKGLPKTVSAFLLRGPYPYIGTGCFGGAPLPQNIPHVDGTCPGIVQERRRLSCPPLSWSAGHQQG